MATVKKSATKATSVKKISRSNAKTAEPGTSKKATRKAKSVASTSTKTKKDAPKSSVAMDRRGAAERRSTNDRRQKNEPVAVERRSIERRKKVNRRRQIDPTTCERDYTVDEVEFMNALDDYKRTSGRMFPTCSEVLEVLRGLGYAKRTGEESWLAAEVQAAPVAVGE